MPPASADLHAIRLDGAVRIGTTATVVDPTTIDRARAIFAAHHALALPDAFDRSLLAMIMALSRNAAFEPDLHEKIGARVREKDDRVGHAMRFIFERAALLDWATAIVQCEPLAGVTGVLTEMRPGVDHAIGWHDDRNVPSRRLALIVHLSDAPFGGGRFELGRKDATKPSLTIGYLPPGSIMIFRVDATLRHRVTAVEGTQARRVFAGWITA